MASHKGYTNIVKYLIDNGACIDVIGKDITCNYLHFNKKSALDHASEKGFTEIVSYFKEKKKNIVNCSCHL